MRSYRASNRIPLGGFLLLILIGGGVAVGLGLALWEISSLLNFLAIMVVLFTGLILGGIFSLVVRISKIRNPLIAGLIGLLAGVLLYGVYQYAGYYVTFRDEMRAAATQSTGKAPSDILLNSQIDKILVGEVGRGGFVGYLMITAKYGITFSSSPGSSSSSDVELTDAGVWIYWGLEMLMIAGFAAFGAARAARQPFDEESNEWYGKPTYFASASTKSRKALMRALKDGDFQTAGSLLTTDNIKYPRIDVTLRRGASAPTSYSQQDVFLIVNHVQRKGRNSAIRSGVISPSEFSLLQLSMSQQPVRAAGNVIAEGGR